MNQIRISIGVSILGLIAVACGSADGVEGDASTSEETGTAESALTSSTFRVRLHTGDDNKRHDTSVRLRFATTTGPVMHTLSPLGETLADFSVKTSDLSGRLASGALYDVTGCSLVVDRGEGDGLFWRPDDWWMTGLQIDVLRSGAFTPFIDLTGWTHKFVADETLPCPPGALPLRGAYRGVIHGDRGSSATITTTYSGVPASINASVTLNAGLIYSCLTRNVPVGARAFGLTGNRTSISADGESSTYTLSGSFSAEGTSLGVRVNATLYNDGLFFDGNVLLDGPCDKTWPFTTDRI